MVFPMLEKFEQWVASLDIPPRGIMAITAPPVYAYPFSVSMAEFIEELEMTTVLPPEKEIPLYDVLLLESIPSPVQYI